MSATGGGIRAFWKLAGVELTWRVVAATASEEQPALRGWMLKPEAQPDGSRVDIAFGVLPSATETSSCSGRGFRAAGLRGRSL